MNSRTPPLLTAWILWSTGCAVTGWVLSFCGALHAKGYAVALLLGAIGVVAARKLLTAQQPAPRRLRWRRFRRPLPLIFASLAAGALLGGLLYTPNNYDALTYRVPRLLHWLAEGRWCWIITPNFRANIASANSEWLLAPLLVFTRSDRLFFLPNLLSFLLLPGLIFSTFRLAGVRPRVAWAWMWLLPTGLCYVMQAGSIGNDLLTTVYALAAVHYTLRARAKGELPLLWLSILAIALLTGGKVSNLPLLLPWMIASLPALPRLRQQPAATLVVGVVAVMVSFLPSAALNHRYTGHWGGDPQNQAGVQLKNPVAGVVGNSLQLVAQGTAPPLLPWAREVESWINRQLPGFVTTLLKQDYPRYDLGLKEIAQEEGAGLGLGVTLMLAGSWLLSWRGRRGPGRPGIPPGLLIGVGAWLALAFYLGKMGSEATARLLTPYYPLLVLPLLLPTAQAVLVRQRWWQALAGLAAASAFLGLVLTPSRPLFPALTLVHHLAAASPGNATLERACQVYTVYRQRNDGLAAVRAHLPADVREIGVAITEDDSEVALWRPFGTRRARHVTEADLARGGVPGIAWNVVRLNSKVLSQPDLASLQALILPVGGRVVAVEQFAVKASQQASDWAVVHFDQKNPPK